METIEFQGKLQRLIYAAAEIQVRLSELREFEKQWHKIFESLYPRFGRDVKIKIANKMLLESYQYDKYHMVCDDLLSLIDNEIQNEFSVCRNASKNLQIRTLQEYINDENLVEYRFFEIDAKTGVESYPDVVPSSAKEVIANERRAAHLAEFNNLFGDVNTDNPTDFLIAQLKKISSEITGLRHLFSHRNQLLIQQRHVKKWDEFNFSKFEYWFESTFKILQKIFLISTRSHHKGIASDWNKSVSDQMDLILFGTIDRCLEIFFQDSKVGEYSLARKEFYASERFAKEIVAEK